MILIKTLAEDELFRKNTNLSQNKINRKEDIELVSRFFAYSNNLDNYDGSVMNFVDDYIREAGNNWSDEKKDLFADEFNKTMEFVSDNFERGFQKDDRNHTPRVRFEALSVGINLALRKSPQLNISKEKIDELLKSDHLKKWTTSDAANNKTKVIGRIHGVRDFLLNGDFND